MNNIAVLWYRLYVQRACTTYWTDEKQYGMGPFLKSWQSLV